ncbi:oxidoreductase [Asticcacaulis machinosus]|uniref:Oxidoreductase n=1 Tax=Asticcacaulis machinosus TaxID=2984211 RepID=A0ABT5HMM2_9CAUL|nr:oxidoreductase [Asticcacaulis machinosus]MDC7677496.1 oxidoreductase [Asticcacaulis machinosus]
MKTIRKVWFITGATRGFGVRIAQSALDAGDQVVATGRKVEAIETALGHHPNLLALPLDVTSEAQAQVAVAAAVKHFGRIDVLVNNAGYGLLSAVEEATAAEVERLYATNVFGLLNVTRAVLPQMRRQRSGHIINLSSLGGYMAYYGWGVYGSTKFAVEGLTEAMSMELAPLGIHATVVEPGFFRTDFLDDTSLKVAREIADYADTVGQMRHLAADLNHAQPGNPDKLAAAILELASTDTPPLRLPLGSDALQRIADKHAQVERETRQWRGLSQSTDFAPEAHAAAE